MIAKNNTWLQGLIALSAASASSAFVQGGRQRPAFGIIDGLASQVLPRLRPAPARGASPLSAVIYGWDGDYEDVEEGQEYDYDPAAASIFADDSLTGPSFNSAPGSRSIIEMSEAMNADPSKTGTFARLAAAHAPPERPIDIEKIEEIHVVNVSDSHVELSAVLCEDGGCVSLFVPVGFKQGCGMNYANDLSLLEDCIWENINELDREAELMLQRSGAAKQNGMIEMYDKYSP